MNTKTSDAALAQNPTLDDLFKKWGFAYNIDWRLIKAHAIAESSLSADAINPADPSYGIGQILCRADNYDSPCQNKFYIDGWSQATPNKLLDPDFNIRMAAQIISKNVKQYGFPRAVAVYNRFVEYKKPMNGPFENQEYVDRVINIYNSLGGSHP